MNKQREVIYDERNAHPRRQGHPRPRRGDDRATTIADGVLEFCPEKTYAEEWDWDGLAAWYRELTGIDGAVEELRGEVDNPHELADALADARARALRGKESELGAESLRELERQVMLRVIDTRWMDHLQEMDYLQGGHRPARDGPARPARRVQERGVRHVRRPRRGHQRGLPAHDHAHPGRGRARARDAARCSRRELHGAHRVVDLRAARSRRPTRSASAGPSPDQIAAASAAAGGAARRRTVVKDKDDPWADVGPQRPVPLRQRQEVQEVPRSERVGEPMTENRTPEIAGPARASRRNGRVPAPRRQARRARRARGEGRRARLLGRPGRRAGVDGAGRRAARRDRRVRGDRRGARRRRGRQRARASPRTTRSSPPRSRAALEDARQAHRRARGRLVVHRRVRPRRRDRHDHAGPGRPRGPGLGRDAAAHVHEVRRVARSGRSTCTTRRPASSSASTARSSRCTGATPTACSPPRWACTGSCASAPPTRRSAARRRSPASRCCRCCPTTIEVDIRDEDLRIDVYRSQRSRRPVGQHDRLGGAHHAHPDRARRHLPEREVASTRTRTRR